METQSKKFWQLFYDQQQNQILVDNNGNIIKSSVSDVIHFYEKTDGYYQFTNFWKAPIVIDGVTYPSTEHYYQAMKFNSTPLIQQQIIAAATPKDARDIANTNKTQIDHGFHDDANKLAIMKKALIAKFTQHADLKKLLLDTKGKKLVEHTDRDNYWGDGGNGSGQNHLGKLLMEVRDGLAANNSWGTWARSFIY